MRSASSINPERSGVALIIMILFDGDSGSRVAVAASAKTALATRRIATVEAATAEVVWRRTPTSRN